MKKQTYILTTAAFIVLAMIACVSAAGVGYPYMEDKTLRLYPGEISSVKFTFQNLKATSDISFKVAVLEGSEIANFIGADTYNVPANTADTKAYLQISVPENAIIGTVYPIKASFATVTSGQSTGVAMGTGMEVALNVIVVSPPVEQTAEQPALQPSQTAVLVAIAAVIIVAIILLLALKKKPRRR